MRRPRSSTFLAVGIAVLALAVAGARLFGQDVGTSATCERPLAWDDTAAHGGRLVAVAGPVAAASSVPDVGGEPTFLNLGNPHPDPRRFDVVIYADVAQRFERPPEQLFDGELVCVVGRVRIRDGVPQIIVRSPASILIE